LDVRIYLDWCQDERLADVEYCRDTYFPTAEIFRAGPHVKVLSGTWNILNSLKGGYETGAEFIFFIEEDVMVQPCFFEWHWAQHERENYFVTCGRRHGQMPLDFYSNPGTCYRRSALSYVMPHICDEYYADTTKYVDTKFPQYRGQDGSLDDGLIRKVQKSVGGKVLCAVPPVAFHQGFHYYDRLPEYRNTGVGIQDRIRVLEEMLPRVDRVDRYTHDFEPYREGL
jgi:hypothetical protein